MAKNKKPRKAYKARPIHSTGCFYSRADIDEVKDIINKAGLIFEVVLKTGRATEVHMNLAEDVLNWGGMLLFDRRWKGQEATVDEFQREHWKALHAFGAIVKRKNAGKTQGYVGTAEELEIISYVGGEVVRLLKEAMELAPFRTLKEFLAVRQIVGERVNQGGTKSIQGIEASARSVLNQRKFSRPEAPV